MLLRVGQRFSDKGGRYLRVGSWMEESGDKYQRVGHLLEENGGRYLREGLLLGVDHKQGSASLGRDHVSFG